MKVPWGFFCASHSIFERFDDEGCRVMFPKMPANDFTRVHIDNRCNEPKASQEPEIREISCPEHICADRADRSRDVRHLGFLSVLIVELHKAKASTKLWLQMKLFHETLCLLVIPYEGDAHTSVAICSVFIHHGEDFLFVLII
jgi:hypothetical protein